MGCCKEGQGESREAVKNDPSLQMFLQEGENSHSSCNIRGNSLIVLTSARNTEMLITVNFECARVHFDSLSVNFKVAAHIHEVLTP